MGKGRKSCFASLFGFNHQQQSGGAGRDQEKAAEERPQQKRQYQGTRVRPRDDDDGIYYGRYGYADRDIDKKATEFIERVHRGMLANDQD
ncbi:hypothetical protein PR202_ga23138 [Eleusine coracana subsp. coracana]|uniref:Uncharacterized protein n=1 Tax=Eleusine coracana subsp. coracana TaxID=191504 RepID=A0AAV5D4G4_ELECO|nr:hypothetical protein QOZ80_1AG0013580 [Eleusine coracana subsp. coracana]GJN05507.1 hypothetical protein PR202_ga23138 [Eleusine coracana subsp. coracana]